MKLKINSRKHNILSFLYIITIIIFQFVILQVGDSYVYQYQNYVTKGNRQDFKVKDISLEESNNLKNNFSKQFIKYDPIDLQTTCFINRLEEKNNVEMKLCTGSEDGLYQIKDIKAVEGRFPKAANEVMIERSWNNHLSKQYKIQDTLRVNYMSDDQEQSNTLIISGIYESEIPQSVPIIWGNSKSLQHFPHSELTNDFYFLSLASKEISPSESYFNLTFSTYEEAMNAPRGKLSDFTEEELSKIRIIHKKFIENQPKMELFTYSDSVVNSGNVMRYISLLIILPLILTLVALQYLQTKLHIHEFRTLRYLGCNRIQLYLQVWKESLLSAIPAVIAGILIASILNIFIGNYILDNLIHFTGIKFRIIYTWQTYLVSILLGIVPLFLSSTITMISLRQKYPLQALLQKQKKPMKSFRDVLHFSRLSTMFIICIFSIMLFFYMISVNLLLVLPENKETLKEQISSYEIMPYVVDASLSKAVVDELTELKNVKKVYLADNGVRQMLNYKDKFIPHYVYNSDLMDVFLKANNLSIKNQDFIIYVLPNAASTTLQSGKDYSFQLQTMNDETSTVNIKIDKITSANLINLDGIGKVKLDSPILLFSEKSAKETFGKINYTNAFLDIPNTLTEKQVRKISTILNNSDFAHGDYEKESYDGQLKVVTVLLGYFSFIIIFTAMLCFYCVLSCIMMTKQKDLGILRAIGLSKKRLFISMSLEVFYMLILSSVFAFLAFYILYSFFIEMSKANGMKILEPSFSTYLWTLTLGVLACMLVLTTMIYHQSKRQIIVEIKESEGQ